MRNNKSLYLGLGIFSAGIVGYIYMRNQKQTKMY